MRSDFVSKYVPTAFLLISNFAMPALFYLFGLCIYDTFLQNNKPVQLAYIVFITQGAGVFIGDLLSIIFVQHVNTFLCLGLVALVAGLSTTVYGLGSNFILTNVVLFLGACATEIEVVVRIIACIEIWQDLSSLMLIVLSIARGVSLLIGPMIFTQFLHNKSETTQISIVDIFKADMNTSISRNNNYSSHDGIIETRYYIPLSIYGSLWITASVGYLTVYIIHRASHFQYNRMDEKSETDSILHPKPAIDMLTLVAMCAMLFGVCGLLSVVNNLFTLYTVESGVGITPAKSALILSVAHGMGIVGYIFSSIITKFFNSAKSLFLASSSTLISSIILLATSVDNEIALWIAMILICFGLGPMVTLVVCYMVENYVVSRRQNTLVVVIGNLGRVIIGILAAVCQIWLGPFSFEITVAVIAMGCFIIFFIHIVKYHTVII